MTDIQRVLKVIKWLIYNDFAENDRDLSAKLGYNITYFSQIKSGKAKISEQFIEKLCNADPNLNKIWVISGKGEMLKSVVSITYGTMKKRLFEMADFQKLPIDRFEVACGLQRGSISNLSENECLSSEQLTKIIGSFSFFNIEWILTGKGEMFKEGIDRNSLKPGVAAKMIKAPDDSNLGIPLIPIDAMAGFGNGEMQVLEYECERYIVPMFRDADFLISIRGSSMYPKYSSGDLVACKKLPLNDLFFQWNKVYVLDTSQGALVKRIRKGNDNDHILLVSDNESYEPFELHKSQINAVALVVGVMRLE